MRNSPSFGGDELRHGIIAVASPRVTAQDATYSQVESLYRAVLLKGLHGVLAAGGREAARGRRQRRDAALVEPDGQDEQASQQVRQTVKELRGLHGCG